MTTKYETAADYDVTRDEIMVRIRTWVTMPDGTQQRKGILVRIPECWLYQVATGSEYASWRPREDDVLTRFEKLDD
jgi:hypothetical protein